jgi:amino acid transporter
MSACGIGASDIYGLMGTLATFGFLTAYVLVSIAAPIFLKAERRLTVRDGVVSALALLAMSVALIGNVYPVPPPPYNYLPYIYVGVLLSGLTWSMVLNARTPAFVEKLGTDLDTIAD